MLAETAAAATSGWFLEHAFLIPVIPAVAFFIIIFFGKHLPKQGSEVGILSMVSGLVLAVGATWQWIQRVDSVGGAEEGGAIARGMYGFARGLVPRAAEGAEPYVEPVIRHWTWWQSGGTEFGLGQHIDGLAVMLLLLVTFISTLVQIFSLDYVRGDRRYTHFFASLTLFSAGMLTMVLAENTVQLILGWEIMGLCSFMLIGHWWEEQANSRAALKAFFTVRVGDMGLLVGVAILFGAFGTFSIQETSRIAMDPATSQTVLLWAAIVLMLFGMVMVYSASIALPDSSRFASLRTTHHLTRHAVALVISLCAGLFAFAIPVQRWQKAAPWLFVAGLVLLVLVLVPGIGRVVLGARRWISLGPMNLQPSELMKLFVVLYAADYTVRKAAFMGSLRKGFLPMAGVMLFAGTLLLMEPDFGAFSVITIIAMGLLFLGGMNWRLFAVLVALLVAGFMVLILIAPYRLARVTGFLDPWKDPLGSGYQLTHSLIAFGRGELFGVGLGASVEKLFYLPEAHTDFLLAVIAEELGFVGVATVLALFVWLVTRAFAVGRQAARLERYFSALVAQGIGLWIGVQALINMGVNMGVLPTKGLTLPMLSFGGTGIVVNMAALAILLRVDYENRQMMMGRPA
jgi:cell division protein FtsW